jgi:hypothetical protein
MLAAAANLARFAALGVHHRSGGWAVAPAKQPTKEPVHSILPASAHLSAAPAEVTPGRPSQPLVTPPLGTRA